jgi:hypothetical protein
MKPRIKVWPHGKNVKWECSGDGIQSFGASVTRAFLNWRRRRFMRDNPQVAGLRPFTVKYQIIGDKS